MPEITIMPNATSAALVFEREFLPLRGKLLEVAASLDRVRGPAGARPIRGATNSAAA